MGDIADTWEDISLAHEMRKEFSRKERSVNLLKTKLMSNQEKGILKKFGPSGKVWKEKTIYSLEIHQGDTVLMGESFSDKFMEFLDKEVAFTKEPDSYNQGKWKFKFAGEYGGKKPFTGARTFGKESDKYPSFALAYANQLSQAYVQAGKPLGTENTLKLADDYLNWLNSKTK